MSFSSGWQIRAFIADWLIIGKTAHWRRYFMPWLPSFLHCGNAGPGPGCGQAALCARGAGVGGGGGMGPWDDHGLFHRTDRTGIMDAEHINLIGNSLADLAVRTQELRRYL